MPDRDSALQRALSVRKAQFSHGIQALTVLIEIEIVQYPLSRRPNRSPLEVP